VWIKNFPIYIYVCVCVLKSQNMKNKTLEPHHGINPKPKKVKTPITLN
jgi:hypothetical protein